MLGKVGDRIIVESERMDVPPREGEILEIIAHEQHTEFRVRWEDGHETEIRPSAGSYRIVEVPAKTRKA